MGAGRFLVFDCDGVLADTERTGHLPAFNRAFREFNIPIHWNDTEYAELVKIGGGKERMFAAFTPEIARRLGLPANEGARRALVATWHARKSAIYADMVHHGELPGRAGVARLATAALGCGWRLAVASTSAEASVRAVLEHVLGSTCARRVDVYAGDIVPHKKPAPDIYRYALQHLGADSDAAVVIEDSGIGLAAARAAGLRTLISVSAYTRLDDFRAASLVVDSLGGPERPARVLSDPLHLHPGPLVDVAVLSAILAAPLPAAG